MPSFTRRRTRGGYKNVSAYYTFSGNGQTFPTHQPVGTLEFMDDVVTKPFIPGRTWSNNAMLSNQTTKAATPVTGAIYQNIDGKSYSYSGSYFTDRSNQLDIVRSKLLVDRNALVAQACTSALANIRKPELSGIVSLIEMRETIKSLLNPVNGALNWLSRNAPTKRPRRKRGNVRREIVRSAQDIADQHLTIVFGIMPFINDVQATLKALEAIEPVPVRMTARGTASAHDRQTLSGTDGPFGDDGSSYATRQWTSTADLTVTVRAYQLYEASVSLQNALGFTPSDVPKGAWQTATLSFVVDWFANVGDYISALTPQAGIRYLTSGTSAVTVEAASDSYSESRTATKATGFSGTFSGGSQSVVVVTKARGPADLLDHARVVLKSNMHRDTLDTFKVTAALSLLTQRLAKLL